MVNSKFNSNNYQGLWIETRSSYQFTSFLPFRLRALAPYLFALPISSTLVLPVYNALLLTYLVCIYYPSCYSFLGLFSTSIQRHFLFATLFCYLTVRLLLCLIIWSCLVNVHYKRIYLRDL
jgi:hypothetical protein